MTKNLKTKDIDQLLTETDVLTRRINSGFMKDMEEAHRMELEKHVQNLKRIKSDAERKAGRRRRVQ